MASTDDVVRASELGQYDYCARAWWLGRVRGVKSENSAAMERGTAGHRAHGRAVAGARRLRWLGATLLLLSLAALAALALLAVAGGSP